MRRVTTRKELIELNQQEHDLRGHGGPLQRAIAGAVGPPAGLILWLKYATGKDLVECHREAINLWAASYTVGAGNALFLARHTLVDPEAFRERRTPLAEGETLPPGVVPFGEEPQYVADRLVPFWGGSTAQEQAAAVNDYGDPDKPTSQTSALFSRLLMQLGLVLPSAAESFDLVGDADCVSLDDWRAAGRAKPHMWLKGLYASDPEAALCVTTIDATAQAEATERSMQTWCTGKRLVNEGALACQLAYRAIISGPRGGQFATKIDAEAMPAGAVKAIAMATYWLDSRHALEEPTTFRYGDPVAAVGDGGGLGAAELVGDGEAPSDA